MDGFVFAVAARGALSTISDDTGTPHHAPTDSTTPTPDGLFRACEVDDQPDDLGPRVVYVVGEGEHRWLAAFLCPCGCGATVILNLVSGMRPRWEIERHEDDLVTLTPSINRIVGCRSHFFIRRGRVEWCGRGVSEHR